MSADDYRFRGRTRIFLRNFKGAIQDYDKAIEMNPRQATTYYWRGMAKYEMGDKIGALSDFSMAEKSGYVGADKMIRKINESKRYKK
jgi:tetratricopeptide (TPR) repeat protein